MYPLSSRQLSVHELAAHWLKHRADKATASDLVSELLKRFWLGELPLRSPGEPHPWARRELLAVFRRALPDSKVEQLFAPPEQPASECGDVVIELPSRIQLPDDPSEWTDVALEQAYLSLAQYESRHYPELVVPGIAALVIDREDFAALCDQQGWPRPGFWFRTPWPSQGARSKTNAILACRQWLRGRGRSDQASRTKKSWREEATRLFPGLTQRGFERAWAKEAPASWRRSGRRPRT